MWRNISYERQSECMSKRAGSYSFQYINFLFIQQLLFIHSCSSVFQASPWVRNSQFSSVQLLSHVQLFVTPWTAACQAFLFITNSQSLLKLMSIASAMPSNHLIFCHPLLLLPSIFPRIRVFSNEYWKQISFRAISFRMDWLDLLAVQGTLKSLLQHHSSKATILCA